MQRVRGSNRCWLSGNGGNAAGNDAAKKKEIKAIEREAAADPPVFLNPVWRRNICPDNQHRRFQAAATQQIVVKKINKYLQQIQAR